MNTLNKNKKIPDIKATTKNLNDLLRATNDLLLQYCLLIFYFGSIT